MCGQATPRRPAWGRLHTDGHEVVGIHSFEDYYAREAKEDDIAGARAHPSFTLVERFTFVDDIVEALVRAAGGSPGSIRNVGGGHRVSLSEAVALLGEVVGATPRIDRRPVEAGDVRDTWADVARAWRSSTMRRGTT